MSYEPTNWKTGDVVTSTKLNKLEEGVATASSTGALLVTLTYDNEADDGSYTSSHTAQEIFEALMSGTVVEMMESNRAGLVVVDAAGLSAICFAVATVSATQYALGVDKYSMNPETNKWTVTSYNANFDS